MNYTTNFSVLQDYGLTLGLGFLTTLGLSILSIVCGTLVALPLVRGATTGKALVRYTIVAWIGFVRSIPLLVLLTGAYYMIPAVSGIRLSSFVTANIVFTIYLSAFVADILRNSVEAVPVKLTQAGMSLGFSQSEINRFIVWPVVIRSSIIPVFSMYLSLIKYTSLASAISVHELLHVADLIVLQELRPIEAYTAISVLYLLLVVPLSLLTHHVEKRLGTSFGKLARSDA